MRIPATLTLGILLEMSQGIRSLPWHLQRMIARL